MRRQLVVLMLAAACTPGVNVGSDDPPEPEKACEFVTAALTSCPPTPWGTKLTVSTVEELEQQLLGRWVFCGGEGRYSGRGALEGFGHGSGIELWSDAGQLRWAFLHGPMTALARSTATADSGTVRLVVENGRGRAVLRDGDGAEVVWNADFFDGARVLQNGAFDVWNFVPAQ